MDWYNNSSSVADELLPSQQRQPYLPLQNGYYVTPAQRQMYAVRENSAFQSTPNLAAINMDTPSQGSSHQYLRSPSYQQDGTSGLKPPRPNRDGTLSPRRIMWDKQQSITCYCIMQLL